MADPNDKDFAPAGDTRAHRGAALQALSTLGHVEDVVRKGMEDLSRALGETDTPDVMLNDPDSPVNVLQTLTATRAELAAARAALEPFARAYSRKMEQLGDVEVTVFVDPQKHDHSRTIKLGDLREANRVFVSMTLGVETLDRMRAIEELAGTLVEALQLHGQLDTNQTVRNLLDHATKILTLHSAGRGVVTK